MNKRGQSLITFVLVLPLITLLIAFVIDSSLSLMEKNRIDGIITSNIEKAIRSNIRNEESIKNAIKKNENMDVSVNIIENELRVVAKKDKKSVFGKVLDFDYYKLEYNYCANYETLKINKKCG